MVYSIPFFGVSSTDASNPPSLIAIPRHAVCTSAVYVLSLVMCFMVLTQVIRIFLLAFYFPQDVPFAPTLPVPDKCISVVHESCSHHHLSTPSSNEDVG